jgi:NAD-dependent dihydropyrimidine dehydrogenase PreA subunit
MEHKVAASRYLIELDASGCKACGYCKIVCSKGVYEQGSEINSRGYKYFYPANSRNCIGCMRCFYVCPDFCLDVSSIDLNGIPGHSQNIRE